MRRGNDSGFGKASGTTGTWKVEFGVAGQGVEVGSTGRLAQ